MVNVAEHFVSNGDGWLLHMQRTVAPDQLDPTRPPVLIVPGYGMNAFIFGFHPRGTPMSAAIAKAGYEVWTVNLRAQGPSRAETPAAPGPSMRGYIDADLPAAIDGVLRHTETTAGAVTLVGCSLGGTIAYGTLAVRGAENVAGLISIGSPLRWNALHPALRLAFASPTIVGKVRPRGTRRLMRAAAPLIRRVPALLTPYMNAGHVDLDALPTLVRTVEDPDPRVNTELAEWMRRRDLCVRGVNVTEGLAAVDVPLLVVVANRDGIVPDGAALSVLDAWGGSDVDVLRIGDDSRWYAHADLFIGDYAPGDVFSPLTGWLDRNHAS